MKAKNKYPQSRVIQIATTSKVRIEESRVRNSESYCEIINEAAGVSGNNKH